MYTWQCTRVHVDAWVWRCICTLVYKRVCLCTCVCVCARVDTYVFGECMRVCARVRALSHIIMLRLCTITWILCQIHIQY